MIKLVTASQRDMATCLSHRISERQYKSAMLKNRLLGKERRGNDLWFLISHFLLAKIQPFCSFEFL